MCALDSTENTIVLQVPSTAYFTLDKLCIRYPTYRTQGANRASLVVLRL